MEHIKVFEKLDGLNCYVENGEVCEPGYDNDLPYLFGDWNPISRELEKALLEHYNLEWYDEWTSCGYCGKFFRSSPSSYYWTMYGEFGDGDCTCGDCIKDSPEDTIDNAIGNAATCLPSFLDPTDYGFENLNGTFENGLHSHQTDDPTEILAAYQKRYPDHDLIFGNLGSSQFYVTFEIWGRPKA